MLKWHSDEPTASLTELEEMYNKLYEYFYDYFEQLSSHRNPNHNDHYHYDPHFHQYYRHKPRKSFNLLDYLAKKYENDDDPSEKSKYSTLKLKLNLNTKNYLFKGDIFEPDYRHLFHKLHYHHSPFDHHLSRAKPYDDSYFMSVKKRLNYFYIHNIAPPNSLLEEYNRLSKNQNYGSAPTQPYIDYLGPNSAPRQEFRDDIHQDPFLHDYNDLDEHNFHFTEHSFYNRPTFDEIGRANSFSANPLMTGSFYVYFKLA